MNNTLVNDAIDAVVTHCDFLKQIIESRNLNKLVSDNEIEDRPIDYPYVSDVLLLETAKKVVDGLREFAVLIDEGPRLIYLESL